MGSTKIALSKTSARPRSLREVVSRASETGQRDAFLREFLDAFYVETSLDERTAMLSVEPPLTGDGKFDAYLAAAAEHLAFRYDLPVPIWSQGAERFLKRAFFPCGLESLKATYIVESPTAFRRRMIFVEADPLYRPRRREAQGQPFVR